MLFDGMLFSLNILRTCLLQLLAEKVQSKQCKQINEVNLTLKNSFLTPYYTIYGHLGELLLLVKQCAVICLRADVALNFLPFSLR